MLFFAYYSNVIKFFYTVWHAKQKEILAEQQRKKIKKHTNQEINLNNISIKREKQT